MNKKSLSKVLGGKKYYWHSSHPNKEKAELQAFAMRGLGFSARVLKSYSAPWPLYMVWVRGN